jgi:uncharacterized protein (TIGR02246 family)
MELGAVAVSVALTLAGPGPAIGQEASEERAIRALIESHAVAWNARDIQAAAGVYSENATIVTSSGKVYAGRSRVEEWHAAALSGPDVVTHTHPPETITIYFVRPDVAVADVESHSPGALGPNSPPGAVRKTPLFIVLVKTAGEWRVAAQRPTTLPTK